MSVTPSDFLESARKIDLNGLEIEGKGARLRLFFSLEIQFEPGPFNAAPLTP